eukprot:CAMPEP_0178387688 /NCGR_PEP_ID=MMETSP0689_2-20121128/9201_1 /TAXON_ID=160604 /ORGANISM="Amphidinium massartii, Strain CS-259" /LENGTH=308 /DNA_ID=CAMNT_0020008057 /DNA_START=118 /DNA_END=1041 /DNA_ORIENTATION=+
MTTMLSASRTPLHSTRHFLVQRGTPLTNTFLNFVDEEMDSQAEAVAPRSRSSPPAGCRSDANRDEHARHGGGEVSVNQQAQVGHSLQHHDHNGVVNALPQDGGAPAECAQHEGADVACSQESCGSCALHDKAEMPGYPVVKLDNASSLGIASAAARCYGHQDLQLEDAKDADGTTLLIRNLPARKHMQQDLIHDLVNGGFAFDFCYVPVAFHNGVCRGYGFINCKDHEAALELLQAWHGSSMYWNRKHRKVLDISFSHFQGLDALARQMCVQRAMGFEIPSTVRTSVDICPPEDMQRLAATHLQGWRP